MLLRNIVSLAFVANSYYEVLLRNIISPAFIANSYYYVLLRNIISPVINVFIVISKNVFWLVPCRLYVYF